MFEIKILYRTTNISYFIIVIFVYQKDYCESLVIIVLLIGTREFVDLFDLDPFLIHTQKYFRKPNADIEVRKIVNLRKK